MSKALVCGPIGALSVPVGDLDAYITAVNRVPILSEEEEHDLAIRYRDQNELAAARQLVIHHLRFVVKVARGYQGYGLALSDLVQEGNVGLMKAVKRFDPDLGVRLVSFAVHWIRAEIHEFILRNWRIVKVATTKAQRKLFFNLRSAKKRLAWLSRDEVESVAEDLGVTPQDVMEMEARLSSRDIGFDVENDDDNDHHPVAPVTYLEDRQADPARALEKADWDQHRGDKLKTALSALDERSRNILKRRWLDSEKATLTDLAQEYKVSAERVRQIEANALTKLRATLAA